ncbi:hypothetical protein QQ045_018707 [Rhodiola kirilowii]
MEEEEMLKHDKAANSKAPVFNTHVTCHFCEETGHVNKKCPKWAKYIAWRVKRGLPELSMTYCRRKMHLFGSRSCDRGGGNDEFQIFSIWSFCLDLINIRCIVY